MGSYIQNVKVEVIERKMQHAEYKVVPSSQHARCNLAVFSLLFRSLTGCFKMSLNNMIINDAVYFNKYTIIIIISFLSQTKHVYEIIKI